MDRYLSLFRNLWVVGGIIAALIFVVVLAGLGSGLSLEDLRNLALILGGMIALPLAVWRSRIAAKQVALIEAGLNTDRYQKGASMLGDARLSVRQAGVFGLTELARNNIEEYHILVRKLLCSFIKDRSEEQSKPADGRQYDGKRNQSEALDDMKQKIAPDCKTALDSIVVLSEISDIFGFPPQKRTLNLGGANLARAILYRPNLMWANLGGANLTKADLGGANLTEAILMGANLTKAYLGGANLTDAYLDRANLTEAILTGANLTGANLTGANLTGANLKGVIGLTSAQLEAAINYDPDLLEKLREAEKEQEEAEE